MRKLTFLLILLWATACSNSTPSGNGGGGGGAISPTYIAKDSNGKNLGYVMSASASMLTLVSPNGYFYTITYDGNPFIHPIYTDSEKIINKKICTHM